MTLLPGLLLIALAGCYLGAEIVLRRRSGWSHGVLDHFRWEPLAPSVAIYLGAAVIFSVGSWSILELTAILIIPVLPAVVGMSWLALDPDRPVGQGVGVSAVLALAGVTAVWLGR